MFVLLLAASSSAVVMPILQERGLTGGEMLLATAWIALVDIATIVALPLALDAVAGGCGSPAAACGDRRPRSPSSRSSARAAATARRARPARRLRASAAGRSTCALSLLVLFGLAALATAFGTSILIAGFAAGMIVALAGEPRRLTQQLVGLAEGFFVPFFFVSLGARLELPLARLVALGRRARRSCSSAAIVVCHVAIAARDADAVAGAGSSPRPSSACRPGVVALGLTERHPDAGRGRGDRGRGSCDARRRRAIGAALLAAQPRPPLRHYKQVCNQASSPTLVRRTRRPLHRDRRRGRPRLERQAHAAPDDPRPPVRRAAHAAADLRPRRRPPARGRLARRRARSTPPGTSTCWPTRRSRCR